MTLPHGWKLLPLADLADTSLGKMLDRGKRRGLPQVRYLRNVNVQWDEIDTSDLLTMELAPEERERYAVRPGDLLICEGGEIGRSAIWHGHDEYIAYQKALHRVRSHGDIDLKYLRYLLEHYRDNGVLSKHATGSTIAHLPQRNLRRLPVPHPPVDEQRWIVEILEDHLSRLDAGTRALESARLRSRPLVRSMLASLIPNEFPSPWAVTTVGEAGRVDLGRQRHPEWHRGPEMRPYLRVANVFEDRIDTTDVMEMDFSGGAFERFGLEPGDVLLNEGQSPEWLGRPAIYRGELGEVAFTNSLLRFRARDDVLPEWALLVFRRHMHLGRFRREARITTNIAHLSASRLKKVEFPVPPIDEQQRLVDVATSRLAGLNRTLADIGRIRSQERALRRALLKAAFSGRLTGAASDMDRIGELAGV